MSDRAQFDQNNRNAIIAVSNDGLRNPVEIWADPSTHALVVGATLSASSLAINDGVTTSRKATVANLTNANPLAVEIVDGSGNQITSFGGGTQYAEASTTSPATGTAMLGRYLASPSSLTDGQMSMPLMDNLHQLKVVPVGTVLTNIGQFGGTNVSLGQTTMSASIPVVIASNQSTLTVSGTVTANAGTNLNTSLLALESGGNLATLAGTVSSSKVNVNISSGNITNYALETGGNLATIVTDLTNGTQQTKITDGTNIANVVAMNSGQNGQIVAGGFKEYGSLSAGSLNADLVPSTDVSSYLHFTLQVIGTYSGTLTVQFSNDNTNWSNGRVFSITTASVPFNAIFSNTGVFEGSILGRYMRVRMTAYTSGTATGTLELHSQVPQSTNVQAVQGGSWTVGSTSASVNVGQKTVNTTAVQISSVSTVPTNGIIIGALSTNSASIFIGGSSVTTSTGAEITAGSTIPFTCNLNTLYIISVASTTDKIWWNVS